MDDSILRHSSLLPSVISLWYGAKYAPSVPKIVDRRHWIQCQ